MLLGMGIEAYTSVADYVTQASHMFVSVLIDGDCTKVSAIITL